MLVSSPVREIDKSWARVILLVLLLSSLGWSQITPGRGHLADLRGDLRLPNNTPGPSGILIVLENATGSEVTRVMTDANGRFEFQQLDPAFYVVKVGQSGYQPSAQKLDLTFSPSTRIMLMLIPIPGSMGAEDASRPGGTVSAKGPFTETAQSEMKEGQRLLFQEKKPEESLPHFKKMIKAEPTFVNGYVLLGTALMSLNRYAEAESAFRDGVKRDEKDFSSRFFLGVCLNQQGQFAQAEKPLLTSLEINPDAAEAHYEISRTYLALSKWEMAEPHALAAVKLQPTFAPAHIALGNIYLRQRKNQEALGEFESYLKLDPNGQFATPARAMVSKISSASGSSPR
jgi:tetratricopeptide (TPR) repeat protein